MNRMIHACALFTAVATPAASQTIAAPFACGYGECTPALPTQFLEIRRDAIPARDLQITRFGGYELADGRFQSFSRWYAGRFTPLRADLITQVTPNFGVLWGASGGERGEKFKLQPGFRAGIVAVRNITRQTSVSLTARTTFGGRLVETPCTADYGDVGGVQRVNCRLAATEVAPQDTLGQLWNFAPADKSQFTFSLTTHF